MSPSKSIRAGATSVPAEPRTHRCVPATFIAQAVLAGRVRYYYDDRLFLEMPLPDGLLVEQFSVNTSNTNGTSVADVDNVVISTLGTCPADCNSNGAPGRYGYRGGNQSGLQRQRHARRL